MVVPRELTVRVVSQSPTGEGIAGILVWYNTFLAKQPYFSGLMGLTDPTGVVRLEDAEIKAQFAESQRLFPMDYKVPLEDCEDEIAVGADGGREFVGTKELALTSQLLTDRARTLWSGAHNEKIRSVRVRQPLMHVPSLTSVDLVVRSK